MTDGHSPERISAGCIVRSLAGRDGGRLFVVISAGGGYVYLADGRTRRVEHQKKKKLRHVECAADAQEEILKRIDQGRLTNSVVRKLLSGLAEDGGKTELEEGRPTEAT